MVIKTLLKGGLKSGAKKGVKVVSKKKGPRIVSKKGTKTLGTGLKRTAGIKAARTGLNRAKKATSKVGDANQKKIIAGGLGAAALSESRGFKGRTKPKTKPSKTTVGDSQKNTSINKNLNINKLGQVTNTNPRTGKTTNVTNQGKPLRRGTPEELAKRREGRMGGGMMKKRMKRGGTAKKKRAKRMGGGMMKKRMKRGGRA